MRFESLRTVDSDGDALRENEATGADKGGDLAEGVELEVGIRGFIGRGNGYQVKLEVCCLGDSEDGR